MEINPKKSHDEQIKDEIRRGRVFLCNAQELCIGRPQFRQMYDDLMEALEILEEIILQK